MLSIGTFSKLCSVATKTLRYYDEIGLLRPAHINSENGYRYYTVEQLETMLLINKLKLYCCSLEEIAEVLHHPDDNSRLCSLLKQKHYNIQEKMKHYNYVLDQLEQDCTNLERGIHIMSYLETIEVKLVETQPQNILFIRDKINIAEYGNCMNHLFQTIKNEHLTITGAPMTIFHDEEFNPESYDIEIAIPVLEAVTGTRKFPGRLCAKSILKGAYSELPSIYAKLKQWIEQEHYQIAAAPYEIYLTDPAQTEANDNITEIYLPVKK